MQPSTASALISMLAAADGDASSGPLRSVGGGADDSGCGDNYSNSSVNSSLSDAEAEATEDAQEQNAAVSEASAPSKEGSSEKTEANQQRPRVEHPNEAMLLSIVNLQRHNDEQEETSAENQEQSQPVNTSFLQVMHPMVLQMMHEQLHRHSTSSAQGHDQQQSGKWPNVQLSLASSERGQHSIGEAHSRLFCVTHPSSQSRARVDFPRPARGLPLEHQSQRSHSLEISQAQREEGPMRSCRDAGIECRRRTPHQKTVTKWSFQNQHDRSDAREQDMKYETKQDFPRAAHIVPESSSGASSACESGDKKRKRDDEQEERMKQWIELLHKRPTRDDDVDDRSLEEFMTKWLMDVVIFSKPKRRGKN